jgi:hypothetical protein
VAFNAFIGGYHIPALKSDESVGDVAIYIRTSSDTDEISLFGQNKYVIACTSYVYKVSKEVDVLLARVRQGDGQIWGDVSMPFHEVEAEEPPAKISKFVDGTDTATSRSKQSSEAKVKEEPGKRKR